VSYSFRIRGVRARGDTLNVDAPALDLPSPGPGIEIQLRGWKDLSLKDADSLVLVGTGFGSEGDARTAGERYERVVMRTLAHLRIGADFGGRAAKSWITDYGLKWLEARAPGQRLLNDVHGLMVFASDPCFDARVLHLA
jgi:hypothetical protein